MSTAEPVRAMPARTFLTGPRRWVFRGTRPDDDVVRALATELRLPPAMCRLLAMRGCGDPVAARAFLKPRLEDLLDPFLMTDCDRAVERITAAIRNDECILVHGDYDVDGIASTALLTRVLRSTGARVEAFVPHRMTDGYDLGHAGVRKAVEAGASLIITADCGTTAHEAVAEAAVAGIDVIITDHHTPGDTLPAAVAILNPSRRDSSYPAGLAGAGVAFKLCDALVRALGGNRDDLLWHLDLVALATIADLAPLTGENRVLAHYGLRVLRDTRNHGLRALLARAGVSTDAPIGAGQVSHTLAPRINAVGRMGAAMRGVELLLCDDAAEAAALSEQMEAENRTRQEVDRRILDEALSMLDAAYDPKNHFGVVLSSPGWHPGVIGIVASRVVECIHRPVVMIAEDAATGRGRGSARSIGPFHLYNGIHACGHLLERFGGHRQAAGMDVRLDRIDEFRAAFNDHARTVLEPADLIPEVRVDLEIELHEADTPLCRMLRHCGPFGMQNPQPVFVARNVTTAGVPKEVGGGRHIRMTLAQGQSRLAAIGFGLAERFRMLDAGGARGTTGFDVAFQLQEDTWNGAQRLQARIVDVRQAS